MVSDVWVTRKQAAVAAFRVAGGLPGCRARPPDFVTSSKAPVTQYLSRVTVTGTTGSVNGPGTYDSDSELRWRPA